MKTKRPLIIIHGWSDSSDSFVNMATLLSEKLEKEPKFINLGDYVSMDDDVTMDDIVCAMDRAWKENGFPTSFRSVDVVTHSFSGLIIRHWLVNFYTPDSAPIKNLVMLAPPNFGSHLAHKGRAFYGRLIRGIGSDKLFNVGEKLLHNIELASPYVWNLAMNDLFGSNNFYGPGGVLCTVLVGNVGYRGIAAAANEKGSDGVVRIASANLNCMHMNVDMCSSEDKNAWKIIKSKAKIAFGILNAKNHSTITLKNECDSSCETLELIYNGLIVDDENFGDWMIQLDGKTKSSKLSNKSTNSFQNVLVFVHDQFGNHIKDYFLEFFSENEDAIITTQMFQEKLIKTVHSYSDDRSYRNFYLNHTILDQYLNNSEDPIYIRPVAYPFIEDRKNMAGYASEKVIKLKPVIIRDHFKENTTILMKIKLYREQKNELFQFNLLNKI